MRKYLGLIITGVILAAVIILCNVPALDTQARGELDFQLDGTKLVKYLGTAQSVSIPSEVTEIGEGAFAGNDTIRSVKIPASVEKIDYGAFYGCTKLKGISISNNVETIETGAFAECTSLKSVKIGEGLKNWGAGVFAGDTAIKSFKISYSNPYFKVREGVVYDKDEKILISYSAGKSKKEYTIPYGVEQIYPYAFWGCDKLESVSITGQVFEIGAYAFSNCNGLQNVYFSPSVKNIDRCAFENCVSLTEVKLPLYVETIHETAFNGCDSLTLIDSECQVAKDFAETFNKRQLEKPYTLADIEAKYAELMWGSNTEGERSNESEVVEGNGPTGNMPANQSTEENQDQTPEQIEDFGNLLGSTKVVNGKAVVMIDPNR